MPLWDYVVRHRWTRLEYTACLCTCVPHAQRIERSRLLCVPSNCHGNACADIMAFPLQKLTTGSSEALSDSMLHQTLIRQPCCYSIIKFFKAMVSSHVLPHQLDEHITAYFSYFFIYGCPCVRTITADIPIVSLDV